jgi:hypothetical protein
MVLIQTVPSEIRQLDLDVFRLTLKALEASEVGMSFDDIHSHNPTVTVSGAILARVVQIINGYTVTFEDGQYRVNTVGANSNIGEVTNVNQVSVSTSNSAGLQDLNSLQAASFDGVVAINTNSVYSGTVFPVGTRAFPVNNIADAHSIADERGIPLFAVAADLTLGSEDFSDGHTFVGDNPAIVLTLDSATNVDNAEFRNLTVQGELDNDNVLRDCFIGNVTVFDGMMHQCSITSPVVLGGTGLAQILSCYSAHAGAGPTQLVTIDFGGASGMDLVVRDFQGGMELVNCSTAIDASLDFSSGRCIVRSDVTAGNITVRGVGNVIDESTGTTVVDDQTIQWSVEHTAFADFVTIDTTNGTAGTVYPIGTSNTPVSNLADAKLIAAAQNIQKIRVVGTLILGASDNLDGYVIEGTNPLVELVVLMSGCSTEKTTFKNLILTGVVNGGIFVERCAVQNLSNIGSETSLTGFNECFLIESTFSFKAGLTSPQHLQFTNCVSGLASGAGPVIDMNGSNQMVGFRNYQGAITIGGSTHADCQIDFDSVQGCLTLAATNTAGSVSLRGIQYVNDLSGAGFTVDKACMIDTLTSRESGEPYGRGTVAASPSPTTATCGTDLTETDDDHWKEAFIRFTSGDLAGSVRYVIGYNGTTKVLSFEDFAQAPTAGDTFILINS